MQNDSQIQKLNVYGEIPAARFGHTLTMINKKQAVLFGGAVGDSGKFIITNESYMFDLQNQKWRKLEATGQIPTQRAAHGACQIEQNQLVVYGGAASGGGGLSCDDLYLLDLRNNQQNWLAIPIQGQTPGKRYGHTMVFFKPFLIVFGGNTGTIPVNDTWILNIEKAPYLWQNYQFESEIPCVRVYHAANLCQTGSANGMMVIFGGRTNDQSPLNDCWGLRRHRNGKWDWVKAPYKQDQPLHRYQHQICFTGPLMLVIGGRSNATEDQASKLEIYDTESSDWYKFNSINRYRHAVLQVENSLLLHGGFEPDFPNKPLDSFLQIDLTNISISNPKLAKNLGLEKPNNNVLQESMQNSQNSLNQTAYHNKTGNNSRAITPMKQSRQNVQDNNKIIRISNQAVVAIAYNPGEEFYQNSKKVPLKSLAEESKKLSQNYYDPNLTILSNIEQLSSIFVNHLLNPKNFKQNDLRIPFKKELIIRLCDEVLKIVTNQPIIQKVRVAVKVFGSLHGKFIELLRFFDNFGYPHDEHDGDIEKFDYIFLGNYVDRGFNSLETILALFALKLKFPDHIHLLRGRHEDMQNLLLKSFTFFKQILHIKINKLFGFGEECALRLNEDILEQNSVFQRVNEVFDYMPLAAVIEDKILCVNGGIGRGWGRVGELDDFDRPISICKDGLANEICNSEYCKDIDGMQENKAKVLYGMKYACKFGEQRLKQFLSDNNLTMMITSSQCIQEGFERNQSGTLLNIFSVPDYGGKYNNNATIIKIKKNFDILPLTINPQTGKKSTWITSDNNVKSNIQFSEEEMKLKKRQLTPPRSVKLNTTKLL